MNRIPEARRLRGLTQQELARLVGVGRAAISHYESGRRKPDVEMALRLAEALRTTVERLFGADGRAFPERRRAQAASGKR